MMEAARNSTRRPANPDHGRSVRARHQAQRPLHRQRHRGAGGAGAGAPPARHVYRRHRRARAAPSGRRDARQRHGRGGRRPCQPHRAVELDADGFVTVRDNGRGIPVDPHPKFKNKSALEVILTTLHSGGKFGGKVYETSGGLHGVGLSVVNALSDELGSRSRATGSSVAQRLYAAASRRAKLKNAGAVQNRRGTTIRFHPDPEIFGAGRSFSPAGSTGWPLQGLSVPRRRDPLALRPGAAGRRRRHAGRGGAAFPRRPAPTSWPPQLERPADA